MSERDLLLSAAERIEGMLPTSWTKTVGIGPYQVTTTTTNATVTSWGLPNSLNGALPLIVKMLRETAGEYDPDVRVLCQHCWDNVNLARVILGMEPNYPEADDD